MLLNLNYLCVKLVNLWGNLAYDFYMAISSDHVAWASVRFAKMPSLFPVPAVRFVRNTSEQIR